MEERVKGVVLDYNPFNFLWNSANSPAIPLAGHGIWANGRHSAWVAGNTF